jgi:hypothetical protein
MLETKSVKFYPKFGKYAWFDSSWNNHVSAHTYYVLPHTIDEVWSNNILRSQLGDLGLTDSAIRQLLNSPDTLSLIASDYPGVDLETAVANGYQAGFKIVFYVMAGLSTLAFFIAFFLMPQVDLIRPDDKVLIEQGKREYEAERTAGAAGTPNVSLNGWNMALLGLMTQFLEFCAWGFASAVDYMPLFCLVLFAIPPFLAPGKHL